MATREPEATRPGGRPFPGAVVVLGLLLTVVVVGSGWLSDDSFITFRTVDNLIHGRGMTWNPGWRVQVFTHPLWMLLVSLISAVTGHIPMVALWLGIVLSLGAVLVLCRALGRQESWRPTLFLLLLISSKAFVDYSTGGLENPLSSVLVALFLVELLGTGPAGVARARPWVLGLLGGLLFLDRMDLALLAAPALALVSLQGRLNRRRLGQLAAGALPVAAWLIFATLYFGSPIPNTAWAKLGTGIPRLPLVRQGLAYLWNSLRWDPVTLAVIVLAGVLAIGGRFRAGRAVAAGMALYLAYVVWIGGDFMSGRFLTAVFVCGAFLVAREIPRSWAPVAIAAILLILAANPLAPPRVLASSASGGTDRWGISDERAAYERLTGIRALTGIAPRVANPWRRAAEAFRQSDQPLRVRVAVGMFGYFAGPDKIVVDVLGITEPLLAHLPMRPKNRNGWRIGHFPRNIPEGYLETLALGENHIVEPHLRAYYSKLDLIAHAPLLAPGRLHAIVAINLGRYRHLLAAYEASGACELPAESVVWKPMTLEELRAGLPCSNRSSRHPG